MVRDGAELAVEVLALAVADEAVRVSETETQTFAECRQQAIVIGIERQFSAELEVLRNSSYRTIYRT